MDKDTSRRVTISKTLEEVRVLNAQNDKLLKDFGIDVFSFADPAQELLDQFAQIRLHTGLCLERPQMSLLEEFLYTREAQRLEAKTQAITLGSDVVSLRLRCADETREVSRLECFLEEAHELATTTDEFEKKKANQEKNCEVVKGKLKSLPNVPEDVNLDELIANVQLLEEEDSRRGGDK
ncbi:AGAP006671-PA [Anopheles gambiae str. PEST]|uniref:AGAP006671-PA n=2 Tax=gambiae species complex TaxID=44542 RepID=Q7PNY8_ANOGA|nr:AGAP006671-PA [Anopheles gambiae str. PEST]